MTNQDTAYQLTETIAAGLINTGDILLPAGDRTWPIIVEGVRITPRFARIFYVREGRTASVDYSLSHQVKLGEPVRQMGDLNIETVAR